MSSALVAAAEHERCRGWVVLSRRGQDLNAEPGYSFKVLYVMQLVGPKRPSDFAKSSIGAIAFPCESPAFVRLAGN